MKGKVCVVTGGSRGLGLEIARRFAGKGASIVVVARNKRDIEGAVAGMPCDEGQSHYGVEFDVGCGRLFDNSDLHAPVATKGASPLVNLSDVGVLVNSAGISQSTLLTRVKPQLMDDLVRTNLIGTMMMSQAVLKHMMRNADGCIINLSSVLAHRGGRGSTVYAATKGGVLAFTRALACEVASRNVRANCIVAGLADTNMGRAVSVATTEQFAALSPLGLVTPQSVADAAEFLATSTQITGQSITVDSGFLL